MKFPDDANGDVLRQMYEEGDDLLKPRRMDFCFVFPQRTQALEFAAIVDEQDMEVCISYYEEREMWQVIVQRMMVPTHSAITSLEMDLTHRAKVVGGEPDGWGGMIVKKE
jgi:hypothetical protein